MAGQATLFFGVKLAHFGSPVERQIAAGQLTSFSGGTIWDILGHRPVAGLPDPPITYLQPVFPQAPF
jgi:hypothetical protein